MVKGVSIKLISYEETVPKLLKLIKFDNVLKKHKSIVIKPFLNVDSSKSSNISYITELVKFCSHNMAPRTELFIADGVDGADTFDVFDSQGYKKVAENYGVGLIDLNKAECEAIGKNEFVGFDNIYYPSVLSSSFVIAAPSVRDDERFGINGALASMNGAFPSSYYKGFFSSRKNKLDSYQLKHQVHDIALCKLPDFALLDINKKGVLLAGQPIEMDKQAAKLFGIDWKTIGYLRMLEETLTGIAQQTEKKQAEAGEQQVF